VELPTADGNHAMAKIQAPAEAIARAVDVARIRFSKSTATVPVAMTNAPRIALWVGTPNVSPAMTV